MNPIRKIYNSACARIYSVGKQQAELKKINSIQNNAVVGNGSKFYSTASLVNLSGKMECITIGSNCHLYGNLTVLKNGGTITIGNNCSVGDLSRIVSGGRIDIGDRVMIAHNVNILDNNSHPIDANERAEDFLSNYNNIDKHFDLKPSPIVIEDDVWIGFNCIILKGVKIGRGAIIGAGAVVTKNVEPWTINVGNPLRCVETLLPGKKD